MINQFKGRYFFLSNFFPCNVIYEGLTYLSSEAAFQAAKTLNIELRKKFCNLNPSESKKLGRKIKLRTDWEDVKDSIMEEIVRCKFKQNHYLMVQLLYTIDEELIEGNDWRDDYWGVILATGKGKNKLGKILMKIRDNEYKLLELLKNPPVKEYTMDFKGE